MLGCDPLTALLGAGLDPRSPQVVWKRYLRALAEYGAAVRMLGPDVMLADGIDPVSASALVELAKRSPPGEPMPVESAGVLAAMGQLDVTGERINARVAAYFRHITKVVGKELAEPLLSSGAITASAGIHVAGSHLVAVMVHDAEQLTLWRTWATQVSGDLREMHTAPTLVLSTMPGGGIYLFRTPATAGPDKGADTRFEPLPELQMMVGGCLVTAGDVTVPIPPTRMFGHHVMRLGSCRALPAWLESMLRTHGAPAETAA